jgi:hypothetical protein
MTHANLICTGFLTAMLSVAGCSKAPPSIDPSEVLDLSQAGDAKRYHQAFVAKASGLVLGRVEMQLADAATHDQSCKDEKPCKKFLADPIARIRYEGQEVTPKLIGHVDKGASAPDVVSGMIYKNALLQCGWFEDAAETSEKWGSQTIRRCDFKSGKYAGTAVALTKFGYLYFGTNEGLARQADEWKNRKKKRRRVHTSAVMKDGKMVVQTDADAPAVELRAPDVESKSDESK